MNPQAIFKEMTPRARIGLGAAALGVVVVLFFLLKLATAPSYVTIMTGVTPDKSDAITSALADRGVAYQLGSTGSTIQVPQSQLANARVALANAGVSTTDAQPGFELLDQQKLGASDFQQRVTYQRALEGEIGNTIGKVDGVDGAQVQLTLPEDKLFSSEETPATAAVLLSGGTGLDSGQVRGIASLVASSVTGLKLDNVTITDGNGEMLWPTGDGVGSGGGAKIAAQAKYDSQIENNVNAMLERTLGPNKARVEVAADLNMDTATKEELAYANKGTALTTDKDTEKLAGTTPGGGTSGTAANIAGSTAAGGGSGSNYDHTIEKNTFGVGKTVTKTTVAPGSVNTMKVALLVDSKVPTATANQLQDLVSSAAGLDAKRGDTITTTTVPFAAPATAKKAAPVTPTTIIGVLKYVLAGLAAIVFLLLASRALRRREATDLTEPTWLREIESPRPLSELVASLEGGSENGGLGSGSQGELESGNARDQLAAVAAQDPERLARQLRQWMAEGEA